MPQAVTEPEKLFGAWLASKASLFSRATPCSRPQIVWASVFASDMASGLSSKSLPPL